MFLGSAESWINVRKSFFSVIAWRHIRGGVFAPSPVAMMRSAATSASTIATRTHSAWTKPADAILAHVAGSL